MVQERLFFANPKAQLIGKKKEILDAIDQVMESGVYIQGPCHAKFEEEFADYLGAEYVIGVGNGTDALFISLMALDIQTGDEVVVPSHTAPPTISAIRQIGAVPRFIDVEEDTYLISPASVQAAITDKTKAVIAVHLYGGVCEIEEISRVCSQNNVPLIEDCAQATGAQLHGKRAGIFGDLGCYSFFPTKNLGGIGDGGAIATSNKALAEKVKRLRTYGWSDERICVEDGINSRLDEMQAAILSVKLPSLDADNLRRAEIAKRYSDAFSDLPLDLPQCQDYSDFSHVFHLYVVACDERDDLKRFLDDKGIVCGIHYPVPCHLHPAYEKYCESSLPNTEKLTKRILSLPLYPELSDEDVDRVCHFVQTFYN